ncbi:hypothetical protein [Saprospira grandis]|uniref:Uncharacterized protein n=2 Tax=Saprospira grandis TaxID=1008 RepID=H6L5E1_SAPGL|nr:hypothetical protein [Saprospira grandis]AFC24055.1 hypothetical protein SGRA_1320 [Saprospira grandis str. Lewin]EJF52645.1 hypothetical protein SapgrDRAFT_0913 [Saprospira grandis DSM 2844]
MFKIIAREFIWLIVALIVSLPMAVVFLWFFGYTREVVNMSEIERNWVFWMYLIGYFTSFLGIYIMRFIALSIKTLTQPEAEEEEE